MLHCVVRDMFGSRVSGACDHVTFELGLGVAT